MKNYVISFCIFCALLTTVNVCEGSEEARLRSLVNELNLSERVTFLGTVKLDRGIALLKGAIATVVPSLSEGGGLVNVEAQAAGCPVIASRVGGIPEYVKDNESGILFESGNYKELAEKIERVINDEKFRQHIIKSGYEHAKLFDWRTLVPQYIKLYLECKDKYVADKDFKPWSNLTKNLWSRLIS